MNWLFCVSSETRQSAMICRRLRCILQLLFFRVFGWHLRGAPPYTRGTRSDELSTNAPKVPRSDGHRTVTRARASPRELLTDRNSVLPFRSCVDFEMNTLVVHVFLCLLAARCGKDADLYPMLKLHSND